MTTRHDIVIVGGGLVGASLALALEPLGLDVAMLEATPSAALPAVFDERNLSLAEATCHALKALKVWPLLKTASPIRRIHASRQGDFGRVVLDAREHGREAFGHVVIARDFGEALETRLGDVASLTRYRPARFIGTTLREDGLREVRFAGDQGERIALGRSGFRYALRVFDAARSSGVATVIRNDAVGCQHSCSNDGQGGDLAVLRARVVLR